MRESTTSKRGMIGAGVVLATSALFAHPARALGPQPPDQVDVFYQANVRPQVEILIDTSSSMSGSAALAVCPWYQSSGPLAPVSSSAMNKKHHQVRAALVGCNAPNDGIIDKWSPKVDFAVRGFSGGTTMLAPFGSSASTLESAVTSYGLSGGTSMTLALRAAGADFQGFNDGNSLSCRPNFILLLSDGNPNSSGGTFDFECDPPGPADSLTYGAGEPWCGAGYLAGSTAPASGAPIVCTPALTTAYSDMICGLSGNQAIKTYSIGFGRAGSFSPSTLQKIATMGKGQYFFASNVSALDSAFDTIINAMANRAQVTYAAPSIQLEGVFSGNRAYTASFKPTSQGLWSGNLKASCVLPNVLATGDFDSTASCLFKADGGDPKRVISNPLAADLYTGTAAADVLVGGAGQILRNRLATTPSGPTPKSPLYPRNLLTWRPGTPSLVPVSASTLNPDDLFIHGTERAKTINRLHGYTYDVDLGDSDGAFDDDVSGLDPDDSGPVAVAPWPLADSINSNPLVLSYEGGARFVVLPANDGMIHAFDATSGAELSALMPGEVMRPNGALHFSVRDAMATTNIDVRHPYLLDGAVRLFHEDDDADLRIDNTERARLVVGLGRAGAGYYLVDVTRFDGTFNAAQNRVWPLLRTPGTHYADLADTWAAPWLGKMKVGASIRRVAIFGSGHERGFDAPSAVVPSALPGDPQVSGPINMPCSTLVGTSTLAAAYCAFWFPGFGYPDAAPADLVIGPAQIPNAIAYRAHFQFFDVDSDDQIYIQSGEGSTAEVLSGTKAPGYTTQWVYDDQLAINLVTDGNQTTNAGFVLDSVDYRTAVPGPTRLRAPSIFVVDLDRWNGPGAGPAPAQAFAGTTSDAGMLLRFTSDCGGADEGTRCFDTSAGAAYADLKYMRCPISAEMSVLETGGRIERAYVGDECGQIWRLAPDPATGLWVVNRIFAANADAGFGASWPFTGSAPVTNIRKIERRIDLVRSRCSGKNAIGLYFGTGNVQRPTAMDELSSRSDVAGVIWDDGSLDATTTINDLADVTGTNKVDPKTLVGDGKKGWFFRLRANERMLRDPLVFAQTAYYKTFRATTASTECTPGAGEDAVWSVDSCSSEAYNDANNDHVKQASERLAETSGGDIGASPAIIATRDTVVIVGDQGSLNKRATADYRKARMLNWRLTK